MFIVLEARSQRSRPWQGWFVLKPLFLACRWSPLSCDFTRSSLCTYLWPGFLLSGWQACLSLAHTNDSQTQTRIYRLKQQTFVLSQFWRLPVWDQDQVFTRFNLWLEIFWLFDGCFIFIMVFLRMESGGRRGKRGGGERERENISFSSYKAIILLTPPLWPYSAYDYDLV